MVDLSTFYNWNHWRNDSTCLPLQCEWTFTAIIAKRSPSLRSPIVIIRRYGPVFSRRRRRHFNADWTRRVLADRSTSQQQTAPEATCLLDSDLPISSLVIREWRSNTLSIQIQKTAYLMRICNKWGPVAADDRACTDSLLGHGRILIGYHR